MKYENGLHYFPKHRLFFFIDRIEGWAFTFKVFFIRGSPVFAIHRDDEDVPAFVSTSCRIWCSNGWISRIPTNNRIYDSPAIVQIGRGLVETCIGYLTWGFPFRSNLREPCIIEDGTRFSYFKYGVLQKTIVPLTNEHFPFSYASETEMSAAVSKSYNFEVNYESKVCRILDEDVEYSKFQCEECPEYLDPIQRILSTVPFRRSTQEGLEKNRLFLDFIDIDSKLDFFPSNCPRDISTDFDPSNATSHIGNPPTISDLDKIISEFQGEDLYIKDDNQRRLLMSMRGKGYLYPEIAEINIEIEMSDDKDPSPYLPVIE